MKQKISQKSDLNGKGIKVAIVMSEFNKEICEKLLEEAKHELDNLKVKNPKIVYVPGALEIPVATQKLIKNNEFDVIIALGVVIKGETDHYEHVSRESTHALTQIAVQTGVPVIQGILTVPNKELALARAFRGKEYARAAIQMVHTLKNL
ncbi:6,7-dimethyl-8-ribityllumazine synthase [Patescibacteria group bacterium]